MRRIFNIAIMYTGAPTYRHDLWCTYGAICTYYTYKYHIHTYTWFNINPGDMSCVEVSEI